MSTPALAAAPRAPQNASLLLNAAQVHAQVAVAVELYTIPFYLSALASIIPPSASNATDKSKAAYAAVLSVCTEEMLHLQLAANMCIALGTTPNFTAPIYGVVPTFPDGTPILDPDDPDTGDKGILNASIGNILQALPTMLDIEVPTEFEAGRLSAPYHSIGQMYAALRAYARLAASQAPWTVTNQQAVFATQPFTQTIASFSDLSAAIDVICEQGEGQPQSPPPSAPFNADEFRVPAADQTAGTGSVPALQAQFSHFGRFLNVQALGLDDSVLVYQGSATANAISPENLKLQSDFAALITTLNGIWAGTSPQDGIWSMTSLLGDAAAVWAKGNIPQWTPEIIV
ncbi:MAG TPA: ferritin-like domain-containing protein [Xanthomonadaceae bacterium]